MLKILSLNAKISKNVSILDYNKRHSQTRKESQVWKAQMDKSQSGSIPNVAIAPHQSGSMQADL